MDPTHNRKQTIKIINWNCRGFKGKTSELKNIITKTDYPQVICLQETKMKEKQNEMKIPNYKEIHRQHVSEKGSPGLSILIRNDTNYQMIKTHESQTINYQTVKILTRTDIINVTNVYWRSPISPTQDSATIETMINKENQLLVGDFNAHSQT